MLLSVNHLPFPLLRRLVLRLSLGLSLMALATGAIAQNGQNAQAPALSPSAPLPDMPAAPAAQREEGANALTRSAVQRGALQCAARVEQVSRFLGFGPQAGAVLMAPASPVDQRLFSIAMELPAGASSNSLIDMSFAPGQANGCGATYQSISHWTQSCDALANAQFAGMRKLPPLRKDVTVLDGGPATKVFLMKAGDSGCISIKKEIVL